MSFVYISLYYCYTCTSVMKLVTLPHSFMPPPTTVTSICAFWGYGWKWPLTFNHQHVFSSSLSPSWCLCKIWRNPLEVFLQWTDTLCQVLLISNVKECGHVQDASQFKSNPWFFLNSKCSSTFISSSFLLFFFYLF